MYKNADLSSFYDAGEVDQFVVERLVEVGRALEGITSTLAFNKNIICVHTTSLRRGKLNSQFIVTARMDFQIFSKFSDFKCYTVNIWHFGPAPSNALIGGRGLDDLEFEQRLFTGLKSE